MKWSNGWLKIFNPPKRRGQTRTTQRLELQTLEDRCTPSVVSAAIANSPNNSASASAAIQRTVAKQPMAVSTITQITVNNNQTIDSFLIAQALLNMANNNPFPGLNTFGSAQQPLQTLTPTPSAPFASDDPSQGISGSTTPGTDLSFHNDSGYAETDSPSNQSNMSATPPRPASTMQLPNNAITTDPSVPISGSAAGRQVSDGSGS